MQPSYVENEHFNCVWEHDNGCRGVRIKVRQYTLAQNPDQRPSEGMLLSAVATWVEAGYPEDEVFHLGDFFRVTKLDADGQVPAKSPGVRPSNALG